MAKNVVLVSSLSAPRHPRAPSPGLQEILLSPWAFPIQRLAANPPVARGMIWRRALQPPFKLSGFKNEGWLESHRDGFVYRPLSTLQIGLEGGLKTLGEVLPAAGILLSSGADRAGQDIDFVPELLEALAQWASESSRAKDGAGVALFLWDAQSGTIDKIVDLPPELLLDLAWAPGVNPRFAAFWVIRPGSFFGQVWLVNVVANNAGVAAKVAGAIG